MRQREAQLDARSAREALEAVHRGTRLHNEAEHARLHVEHEHERALEWACGQMLGEVTGIELSLQVRTKTMSVGRVIDDDGRDYIMSLCPSVCLAESRYLCWCVPQLEILNQTPNPMTGALTGCWGTGAWVCMRTGIGRTRQVGHAAA